ncbi:MAG: hypothetical protein H6Q18_929, partial [Bacteroidetes bacterium]|nr:hypothetical protein [Bacteroidota bacterium]
MGFENAFCTYSTAALWVDYQYTKRFAGQPGSMNTERKVHVLSGKF